ncbi:spore germination protein [Paenibacillus silviterrae]|uniref:spore germination protein n=1 Tax=Paenibacillus silviterrae TaxID=3242194 RepID=UPI002542B836|nr:spore germination protein [Paenibacillus chinjuensis]
MDENAKRLQDYLLQQLSSSDDFVDQKLEFQGNCVQLYYVKSVSDEKKLQDQYIIPFFTQFPSLHDYSQYVKALTTLKKLPDPPSLVQAMLRGTAVLVVNQEVILIDAAKNENTSFGEATVENTVQGPKHAFSEDLSINVNLLRFRYNQPSLVTEHREVGTLSRTPICIVYDEKLVNKEVLKEVKKRLDRVQSVVIQAAAQLQLHLNHKKRSIVPTMMVTERPDRVVFNLAQGKVVVLIQGTPFCIVVPVVFYDFMAGIDNFYQHYWVTRFLVFLRYLGLLSSLTLASFYVAFTSYNPELLRVQLALSIAGSRAPVPYPSYIEVLFMLLMMELLTEASIRLPKTIGPTATTVGGLILGQAATQAGLVSNIMIIIVAAVAITNFVIPITEMHFSIRVFRYIILFMTALFGLPGLVLSFLGVIIYMADQESFGQPYLKIFFKSPKEKTN